MNLLQRVGEEMLGLWGHVYREHLERSVNTFAVWLKASSNCVHRVIAKILRNGQALDQLMRIDTSVTSQSRSGCVLHHTAFSTSFSPQESYLDAGLGNIDSHRGPQHSLLQHTEGYLLESSFQ